MDEKYKSLIAAGFCIVLFFFVAITTVVSASVNVNATTAEDAKLDEIQKAIKEKGANWTAGKTSVSGLSAEEKKMLCGLNIKPRPKDMRVISPFTK